MPSSRPFAGLLALFLLLPVSAALLAGCPDPNAVLSLDKFTVQFFRFEVVTQDETGREVHLPGESVQKRVTISSGAAQPVQLNIYFEGPDADAFTILAAEFGDLPEPYNYQVEPFSRLQIDVEFRGSQLGVNQARLVVENVAEDFRREVILQGEVDCVSLGWDVDQDGFCTGIEGPLFDCNDDIETGYASNPGQDEVCEPVGEPQVDNDCNGTALFTVDQDGDGACDELLSCADSPEQLAEECPFLDCDDNDPSRSPEITEVCEPGGPDAQLDNDCDPTNDAALTPYIPDGDGDGFGVVPVDDDGNPDLILICGAPPSGVVLCVEDSTYDPTQPVSTTNKPCLRQDCNDNTDRVFPDAPELCDGLDNDCDSCVGSVGDGCPGTGPPEVVNDIDEDGDGVALCALDGGGLPLDCDDDDVQIFFGAPELCDGKDNDCDAVRIPIELGLGGTVGDIDGDGDPDSTDPDIDGDTIDNDLDDDIDGDGIINSEDLDVDGDGLPDSENDDDSDGFVECVPGITIICTTCPPGNDCDDDNAVINPGQSETACDFVDNNCDGLLHPDEDDADVDAQTECDGDCDDAAPTVFGGAAELCDALDNDCDTLVPASEADDDGDGFVECAEEINPPVGYNGIVGFAGGSDCNDDPTDPAAPSIYPDAPEISDSYYDSFGAFTLDSQPGYRLVDNQCPGDPGADVNGIAGTDSFGNDEYCYGNQVTGGANCELFGPPCYGCTGDERDADGDGLSEAAGDCDDDDASRVPGAVELCDGIDNNCDGIVPLSEQDQDNDGYVLCWPNPGTPGGLVGGDCDDQDGNRNPGEVELADGTDNDCDETTFNEAEVDLDGDCFCGVGATSCVPSETAVCATTDVGDCDDGNSTVNPDAPEVCDELDNDCNGSADFVDGNGRDELDQDSDGYTACGDNDCLDSGADLIADTGYTGSNADEVATAIHPNAVEVCDGWDNDCGATIGLAYETNATNSPDEFDNDGDLRVECDDSGFTGWLDFFPHANEELVGGNDCADTAADTGGISDPLADIYPGAPALCDGWNNNCSGSPGTPFVTAGDDEFDDDLDRYIECTGFVANGQENSAGQVILSGGDCLDEVTTHFQTGNTLSTFVAAQVNPGETEVCDGLNTDCSTPLNSSNAYDADENDEDDDDGDFFLECTTPTTYIAIVGFDTGDCLDEAGNHFQTGQSIPLATRAAINPAATEACDGFDTDCTRYVAGNPPTTANYDVVDAATTFEEDDIDQDNFIECTPTAATLVPGMAGGDCLDEVTTHFETGNSMPITVAAQVNPGESEVCDGLNTDCSLPLEAVAYDADASNEDDVDGDEYVECTNAASYIGDVGFATGDCLDEPTNHFQTGQAISVGLAALINPGATEVCDGFDTDCTRYVAGNPPSTANYDVVDAATSFEEDDIDADNYIECGPINVATAVPGYGDGDCLDEATSHFQTGASMSAAAVAANVNPGAAEACDGLNTDCSLPLQAVAYDAEQSNENDADGDEYLECSSGASWIGNTGFAVGDCLDEPTVHFATGQTISLSDRANVNPGESETCDGLNTDCSAPLAAGNLYDATDSNSGLNEDDNDGDLWLACTGASSTLVPGYQVTDCNDSASAINPGEVDDFTQSLVDNDCDDLFDEDGLAVGDVVFTEVMASPTAGGTREWFEVWNTSTEVIRIEGWVFSDEGSNEITIVDTIDIPANGYVALCDNVDQATSVGVPCANSTNMAGGMSLDLSNDELLIEVPGSDTVTGFMDELQWTSAFGASGVANGLNPSEASYAPDDPFEANDDPSNWCEQLRSWSVLTSDFGSPGAENASCSPFLIDDDGDGFCEGGIDINGDGDCDATSELAGSTNANSAGCTASFCDCLDDPADTYSDNVRPGVPDVCDGYDTNCSDGDGDPDPDNPTEVDGDNDQYIVCTAFVGATTAENGAGEPLLGGSDCDNGDATEFPGLTWYPDADGDLFGDQTDSGNACERVSGTDVQDNTDCLDAADGYAGNVNPGESSDTCDGYDTDCSVGGDGAPPEDADEVDNDNDQYIECSSFVGATTAENSASEQLLGGDECDDGDPTTYPGAPESCDNTDSDCDGSLVDGFDDTDGDGTPDCIEDDGDNDGVPDLVDACPPPTGETGWTSNSSTDNDNDGCRDATEDLDDDNDLDPDLTDCNDTDEDIYNGAPESCDAIDSDCDGSLVDGFPNYDGDSEPDCIDNDDDNDLDPDSSDCDDNDEDIYTGAPESCDAIDSDCDSDLVDGFPNFDGDSEPDCIDLDDDNDLDPDTSDCNDANDEIYTGAPELCDSIDSDCDSSLVDGFPNYDGDSEPDCIDDDDDNDLDPDATDCNDNDEDIYTGAPESCDAIDSDCDSDLVDGFPNFDGDSEPDCIDLDDDNDGDPDTSDCNDADENIYTGAPELCDGRINACGTTLRDIEVDNDSDGYLPCGDTEYFDASLGFSGGGDCNDSHDLIFPGETMPGSPNSATTKTVCEDDDGDGYCLGGGQDLTADGDCADDDEDYDSRVAAAAAAFGDCDDLATSTVGSEFLVDHADSDADTLIDEGCYKTAGGGELVITEVFSEDSDTLPDERDWFEVLNLAWFDAYLEGWTVTGEAGETFTVGSGVSIARQDRAVFAESGTTVNDLPATPDVIWGAVVTFNIEDIDSPATDTIDLNAGAVLVDGVAWDATWTGVTAANTSYVVDEGLLPVLPYALPTVRGANDAETAWCDETSSIWTGANSGTGSPFTTNLDCP